MPAINDLTPEEEAAFTAMGVQPSGPGMEPTGEPSPGQGPVAEPEPAPPTAAEPARAPNGQFVSAQPAPVPPAATAAAPAPEPAPVDPAAPPAPPPGFVPHAALHAERTARQQMQQQMQLLQARTNAMLLANGQPSTQLQPPEMPSLETDPVGYIQTLEQRLARFEQVEQERTQFQQIDSQLEQDEQTFASYTPDYHQASDHYVQSRAQELMALYPPHEAQAIMMNEARQIARTAWERGVPAASMIYQLAQARGYRPGTAPAPTPALPGSSQAAPTPAPAPASPAAVVAAAQAGQLASRSLSPAGGAPTAAALNADALLGMSDEEFAAYLGEGKGANARFAAVAGR